MQALKDALKFLSAALERLVEGAAFFTLVWVPLIAHNSGTTPRMSGRV